jgi:hypothetical protein
MIYRGKVHGGVVVLPPGIRLPEGLDVTVEPAPDEPRETQSTEPPRMMRNGVPVFSRVREGLCPGLELVNLLRDDPL